MIPLEVPRQRSLERVTFMLLCVFLVALAAIIPAQTENALATPPAIQLSGSMTKGYCASDLSGPVVYFSNIFDAITKARTRFSTEPLNFAFKNYLIEEYDFKSSSNHPTQCSLFQTLSQGEASRSQLVSQARQANKQVVEVHWNPSPVAEVPQGDDSVTIGPNRPPPTHTVCAVGHERTMYFSAVFDTAGALINPAWTMGSVSFSAKGMGLRPKSKLGAR